MIKNAKKNDKKNWSGLGYWLQSNKSNIHNRYVYQQSLLVQLKTKGYIINILMTLTNYLRCIEELFY